MFGLDGVLGFVVLGVELLSFTCVGVFFCFELGPRYLRMGFVLFVSSSSIVMISSLFDLRLFCCCTLVGEELSCGL